MCLKKPTLLQNTAMKTILYSLSFLLLLSSCGLGAAADNATIVANKFNQLIVEQKYDKLESFLDESITSKYSEDEIDQIFQYVKDAGPFKEYKKGIGFSSHVNNGVTTVDLSYTLKGASSDMSEDLTLVKRGSTYKISSVYFE